MTDELFRVLLVGIVLLIAGAVAFGFTKLQRPSHPRVTVGGEGDRPGIVLFTSLNCSTCKKTITQLRGDGIPFREITHELEPQRFEEWGVLAVPLTVVVNRDGHVVDLMTGVPSLQRLQSAVEAAGLEVRT